MDFQVSQWRDFLREEGYQPDSHGLLSEEEYAELSGRLQAHTLILPPELEDTDFMEVLESGDYSRYLKATNNGAQEITAPSQDAWQKPYSRFASMANNSPQGEVTIPLINILIDEILHDSRGIERHLLAYLSEEEVNLLEATGRTDEAALLLEQLSVLYQELGDTDNKNFALARASICYGDFAEALTSLKAISSSSPLQEFVAELLPAIEEMEQKRERMEKIMPAIAGLEQMRLRALERLEFDGSQIHDTWYKTESFTADQKEQNQRIIGKVSRGIDEMIRALIDGKVQTIEEAFDRFHTYTSLRTLQAGEPPWTGAAFRQLLLENEGDVDVERLIEWSHITNEAERERALLEYTIDLRGSPLTSLRGYPANTILINLDALRSAKDPETRKKAEVLYRNATGEEALTGMSDAVYAGLLRKGAKSTVPMVLAMMAAGPVGAYAEGAVAASRLTSTGRVVWSGANIAGKAGWVAKGAGFATEATLFWGANDTIHAALLGGGDYFTAHGLASSFLMLGGLRVLGKTWQAIGGKYLSAAAKAAPELKIPLAVGNKGGEWTTELAGFWGIGQFEQLIGLAPDQDTTLRQELFEAGISLMQIKMAVAAGQMATGHLAEMKTLEIKLDLAERLFQEAFEQGRMSVNAVREALVQIGRLRLAMAQLAGPQPAYAGAVYSMGGSGRSSDRGRKGADAAKQPTVAAAPTIESATVRVDGVNPDYFTAYHGRLRGDELQALMIRARDQQGTLDYSDTPWEFPPEQKAFLEKAIPQMIEKRVTEARVSGNPVVNLTIKSIGIADVDIGPGELSQLSKKVCDAIEEADASDIHFNITIAGFDVNFRALETNQRQMERETRLLTEAHHPEGQITVKIDLNYGDLTESALREAMAAYPSDLTLWRYTWTVGDPERLEPAFRPSYTTALLSVADAYRFVDALRATTSGALLVAETFGTENVEIMEIRGPRENVSPDPAAEPIRSAAREAKKEQIFKSALEGAPPNTGLGLLERGNYAELKAREDEVLNIGGVRKYFAHGIVGSEGLGNIFSIIVDRQIAGLDTLFVRMDEKGFYKPYSPFYVVTKSGTEFTNDFIAYVVPESCDRDFLRRALDRATAEGLITAEYAEREKAKVVTYEEFIAKEGIPAER